jgi:hypothetical protein
MKGSTKFWLLMFAVLVAFGNYNLIEHDFAKPSGPFVILTFLVDILLAIGLFLYIILELLPKFNKWLDEKF